MKKILIIILINLIVILAGISLLNKNNQYGRFQTIVNAKVTRDLFGGAIDSVTNIITQYVNPKSTPSEDPISVLGFYTRSGYILQPIDKIATINSSKTLYTDTRLSIFDVGLNFSSKPHYTWRQSKDGIHWSDSISSEKNLTVKSSKKGIMFYQQSIKWYRLIAEEPGTVLISRVASIETFSDNINATELEVKADSNYLYNDGSNAGTTLVKGITIPEKVTGNIIWTVDDTDLATVDKDNGLLTANDKGKSGSVNVTGTITNSDGSRVVGTKRIDVGGGIDDIEVNEGDSATFQIKGKFDQLPTSITWHRVSVNGSDSIVDNAQNLSFSIPKVSYEKDNGIQYYAVIKIKMDGAEEKSIRTNNANLKVKRKSNITLSSSLITETGNNTYEGKTLNNVKEGSVISYTAKIKKGINSAVNKGTLILELPKNISLSSVTLDDVSLGVTVNKSVPYISIDDLTIPDRYIIAIKNIQFEKNDYVVKVNVKFSGLNKFKTKFDFVPYEGEMEFPTIEGETLSWSLENSMLSLNPHCWSYQTIHSKIKDRLIKRVKMSGNALDITDNRVNKTKAQITLYQYNPFKSGTRTLQAETRYYKKDGSFVPLGGTNGVIVEETAAGEPLKSITWGPNEGPLLYVQPGTLTTGTYNADFTWQLVQSVANTNSPSSKIN